MKKKKQITALLAAAAMVFSINSGAIAAEPDIAVEENSRSIGLSCSDMFDMPGPNGQQCIGYLVTNNYTMDLGVGLTIEFRDENYENIGSASAFIPCLASGETEFISVVNCYEDTAEYIYSKWSTCTAVDTTSEPSSISCSDMYTLSGPNGQQCIGYEIINESTLDYFVGLTIEFLDESYGLIGTSSAYIPCLGSGGSTFIYVTNDYGTEAPYVRCSWSVALTVEESAVDDILVNVEVKDDYMHVSAVNALNNSVYLPQITMLYQKDSQPVAVCSGLLTDTTGYEGLAAGSAGKVNISIPSVECDTYTCYMTACLDKYSN